jgi:hypothetical protein
VQESGSIVSPRDSNIFAAKALILAGNHVISRSFSPAPPVVLAVIDKTLGK